MEGLENFISVLDYILDTKRKRHITGGILLSMSMLFGGLALTVMTLKREEEINHE
ncbi:MAG: histidine kinase [Clostridia bacterium]